MQLFRKQALDHQNRLHGEIFLVPPLRWQAIGGLLFALALSCAAILFLGTSSRTISAPAVIHASTAHGEAGLALNQAPPSQPISPSPRVAVLQVPIAQADLVAPGQAVSLVVDGFPVSEFGAIKGTVEAVGSVNLAARSPHREIIVNLETDPTRASRSIHNGIKAQATIIIGRQPLWRWLFQPILPDTGRP